MAERDSERKGVTRREALVGLGLGAGLAAAACGGKERSDLTEPAEASVDLPDAAIAETDAGKSSDDASIPGEKLNAKQLLAGIDHIVVLMMENRSFDHFLGALKNDAGYVAKAEVEGLTGNETNPAPDGPDVRVFKLMNFTPEDPPHDWNDAHEQFNGGKNDGFVIAHKGSSQDEVMGFHDRSQIPFYYWLADNFTVCDHWFSSVLGPTWPNRYYLHATTSKGIKNNRPFLAVPPDTIWDRLRDLQLSYKNYAAGTTTFFVGGFPTKVASNNPSAKIDEFFAAAASGGLPSFSMIDPDFESSDDHPSHNIQRGQAFVASVYKALAESPAWPKTLFIVTYDEHGGFFDHVPPPSAVDAEKEFTQKGFRVPAFVIGPTVRKGYVCKTEFEHSSVAATLRMRFGIKSLSKRMDAAANLSDCIDPQKVREPAAPPSGMPVVAMSLKSALYDGVGHHSQPMLGKLVEEGTITPIDTRSHQERISAWLEHAERLGAVRIVR